MATTPLIAKHALAAHIEQHLLSTVGIASEDATTTDLMLPLHRWRASNSHSVGLRLRHKNVPTRLAVWPICPWSS